MTDTALRVVRAAVEDAGALAAFAERAFRDAFADDNDPADLQDYVSDAFAVGRIEAELADPASTFLLAVADGVPGMLGYAKLRAAGAGPGVEGAAPVELERIYVDRAAQRRGTGAALMRACLDEAARAGYVTLWLGVWERNARALAFYRRWGFEAVGSHVFVLGTDPQTDVVMARAVADPA